MPVCINDYEFLKFDCFGESLGHYHIYDDFLNEEIIFNEKTCEDQINYSCELIKNINVFLNKSNRVDIKNFIIDMNNFVNQIDDVKNKMLEYEN